MALIQTKVYAGRIKNHAALMNSSSGGAFTALSDVFLNDGGAVASAVYDYKTHTIRFQMIYDRQKRDKARGSKYIQSMPCNIFRESYQWIRQNPEKKLLFVGMGCQANGFRKYAELMGIREQVCIVDIVCHGSPSPKLWREYAESIERRYGGRITYLTFRDKRNGWSLPTAFAVINGREISVREYVNVFYSRCALRPSCHECPYAAIERKTDMTIGDFWHIEETIPDFYCEDGNSLFLIHTEQGNELFERVKEVLEYQQSDSLQCRQKNLETPTEASEYRARFWADYRERGAGFIMKKYGRPSFKMRIKSSITAAIRKVKVLYMRLYTGGVYTLNDAGCPKRRAA